MMPLLIQYLFKLTITLAVVYLFYQWVLRRLTFYNSNRWYLAGYTLLSFLIPFINISPVLENNRVAGNEIVQFIPSVHRYTIELEEASHCPVPIWSTNYDKWDWIAFGLIAGAIVFLLLFIIRCISFFSMQRKAKLVFRDGMNLYHVNKNIIPFSFGNSIFVNSQLHTEEELQEIIRHEFVHVKQRHTLDIIWSEWLCIINWYNPFAWLLRASIRQNLEFIADNKVLENGVSKKQYQYLLLKVIGNNQFSIAQKFNFSSLKKRIAMMNKLKTAKLHLVRFLFILPLLAVILLSFRKQIGDSITQDKNRSTEIVRAPDFTDTVPDVLELNDKGYYIDIKGKDANCIVVVKDKNHKEVERLLLTKWKANQEYYDNLYGEILPPPPPVPPTPPTPPIAPVPPADNPGVKAFLKRNPDVKSISWDYYNKEMYILGLRFVVNKKDGTTEKYELENDADKTNVEKKYGKLPSIPLPPPPFPQAAPGKAELDAEMEVNRATISEEFEITENKATLKLKDGRVEKYNLKDPGERSAFEKKYGRIISTRANTSVDPGPVAVVTNAQSGQSVITPLAPVAVSDEVGLLVVDDNGYIITGKEDILLTITKRTTPQQLEEYITQMKEKGIELKFDDKEFDNGVLTHISGTMKFKGSQASFSATDFNKLTLATIKDGEHIYFKVKTTDNKVVI